MFSNNFVPLYWVAVDTMVSKNKTNVKTNSPLTWLGRLAMPMPSKEGTGAEDMTGIDTLT